jgi:hypothetical protein
LKEDESNDIQQPQPSYSTDRPFKDHKRSEENWQEVYADHSMSYLKKKKLADGTGVSFPSRVCGNPSRTTEFSRVIKL